MVCGMQCAICVLRNGLFGYKPNVTRVQSAVYAGVIIQFDFIKSHILLKFPIHLNHLIMLIHFSIHFSICPQTVYCCGSQCNLTLVASMLVGVVGFLGSGVVLSPFVSGCLRLSSFMSGQVLVGVVGFLGSGVVLSPFVSGCLPSCRDRCWLVW